MNNQNKKIFIFNHFLILPFCLISFYLLLGCSWEAKQTCDTHDTSCSDSSSTTTTSPSTTTTTVSSTTTTTASSTTTTVGGNFQGSVSLVSLAIQNTGCSATQVLPDYKEVDGQCLPSCEKRLESNLEEDGVLLGRSNHCGSNSDYYVVSETISEDQIYDSDLGTCCSVRLNNSVNTNINHSCRIVESEKYVQCWGGNRYGQLGNQCKTSSQEAQNANYVVKEDNENECYSNEVPQNDRLSGVVSVALGKKHSCALLDTKRKVVCWGSNQEGQLGVSTDTTESLQPIEVEIPESMWNLNIESISAGDTYGCLKFEENTQETHHCWGSNYPENL